MCLSFPNMTNTDGGNSLASFVTTYMVGEVLRGDKMALTSVDRKMKQRSS